MNRRVMILNAGSSSIKFAILEEGSPPNRLLSGKVDRIGFANASLYWVQGDQKHSQTIQAEIRSQATKALIDWLHQSGWMNSLCGIGHRVVHGGNRLVQHLRLELSHLEELKQLIPFAPEHLPAEIELIDHFHQTSTLPQIICLDTVFHQNLPNQAKILGLPRRFAELGIQRYGFHGLSCTYLLQELTRQAGSDAAHGKIIFAHLGSGGSLTAVYQGRSMDTSMAFSPTAGIPMSTRSGDIDPGVVRYLFSRGMSVERFDHVVNRESGLLGLSESSSDMRDLLQKESTDSKAAETISWYCYQIRKWIGSYVAGLGGLDTLVFSGGIGEHAPEIRWRICEPLGCFGIHLDAEKNCNSEAIISSGPVTVRVIPTDEERVIAEESFRLLS